MSFVVWAADDVGKCSCIKKVIGHLCGMVKRDKGRPVRHWKCQVDEECIDVGLQWGDVMLWSTYNEACMSVHLHLSCVMFWCRVGQ